MTTPRITGPDLLGPSMPGSRPIGIYVHIPFCARKCPYCDFNTYAGLGALYDETVDALCAEMERWAEPLRACSVETVFVGGGTPTVLGAEHLARLFDALHRSFSIAPGAEITSEANPGTVDRGKFAALRALGVNRLSLGVQSFQPDELEFLGRIHDVEDVERAYAAAREVGFDNINLDFIFGLPHQDPERWRSTLDRALALQPDHLSLYSLIVEEGTPLFQWVERGRVDAPDEDLAADLYLIAMERLAAAGYAHYEVSNWARRAPGEGSAPIPQRASRHNLVYWRNGEYLGVGPGAHSHLRLRSGDRPSASRRWGNRKPVPAYVRRIRSGESVEEFSEVLDAPTSMGETMMLGLRLVQEGVPFERFRALHDAELSAAFGRQLAELEAQALVEIDETRVRLTPRGLLLGNQVFARFLPEEEAGAGPVFEPLPAAAVHVRPS